MDIEQSDNIINNREARPHEKFRQVLNGHL